MVPLPEHRLHSRSAETILVNSVSPAKSKMIDRIFFIRTYDFCKDSLTERLLCGGIRHKGVVSGVVGAAMCLVI